MAKVQTRRSISVRGDSHRWLRDHCAAAGISMSEYIERHIEADRRGVPTKLVAAVAVAPPLVQPPPRAVVVRSTPPAPPRRAVLVSRPQPPPAPLPDVSLDVRPRAVDHGGGRPARRVKAEPIVAPARPRPASIVVGKRDDGNVRSW